METVLPEGSPLAAYLEGKGEADTEGSAPQSNRSSQSFLSFAPRGYPKAIPRRPPPSKLPELASDHINTVRRIYATAVSSTLGSSDNERFLEHFRYLIIGSQLLSDHANPHQSFLANSISPAKDTNFTQNAITVSGALISALLAFSFTWILSWATETSTGFQLGRLVILLALTAIIAGFLVVYARRQWLQYLRRQAIDVASDFVTALQSFDSTQASTLTLIQEVELVSRGYRISNPLPPISRIEGQNQSRRCPRLRRSLDQSYSTLLPVMIEKLSTLKQSVNQNDLDRFLDVYDIRDADLEDAWLGYTLDEDDDRESLKHLRILQHRYHTLRRALLCSLLAVPATGQKADAARWRATIETMEGLKQMTNTLGNDLTKVLAEDEQQVPITQSAPASPSHPQTTSAHSRVRSQIRRISALSTGIRSLQAKLYLLREDSAKALSTPTSEADLEDASASLREQYAALGADLQALMQAWEADKNALNQDISRQRRRVSRSSSLTDEHSDKLRPSLGRLLSSVDEDGPHSSTRLSPLPREGPLPLSPPATEDGSDASRTDEEVFEAIASPKTRLKSNLTREERILKMHEERERAAQQREKRDANTHMLKELQSVINLRPPAKRTPHGRLTSV